MEKEKESSNDARIIEEIHNLHEKIEFYLIERGLRDDTNLAEERLVDLIQKLSITNDFEINNERKI